MVAHPASDGGRPCLIVRLLLLLLLLTSLEVRNVLVKIIVAEANAEAAAEHALA